MLNFSGIPKTGVIGRFLRLPLAMIPKMTRVWILQGRLRGYKWLAGASTHGCWLGSYEIKQQKRVAAEIKKGDIVYDVGANVGFYSLLASECVGPQGRVFSFEPLPDNVMLLEKHVQMNSCSNIKILPVAVSQGEGRMLFERGLSCETGKLSENGNLEVITISLDNFIYKSGNPSPNLIKIDVEGAELEVLRGARTLLISSSPIVFLATHSPEIHVACCDFLTSMGYHLEGIDGDLSSCSGELFCVPAKR